MEYIVALLVIAIILLFYFKQPDAVYKAVTGTLAEKLLSKEGEIVYGLYNKLPQGIKDKVDSKTIAEIVSFTIDILVELFGKTKK